MLIELPDGTLLNPDHVRHVRPFGSEACTIYFEDGHNTTVGLNPRDLYTVVENARTNRLRELGGTYPPPVPMPAPFDRIGGPYSARVAGVLSAP